MTKDKKYELNHAFRALVYARDQADFQEKLQIWEAEMQGVEVRVGVGDQAKYVSLTEYYNKNWAPVRHMWARFERRALPLGLENTTNRLERAFGVLKHDLKMSSTGDITIERAVVLVVRWAESKLEKAFATAQRKVMQIFDRDPEVQEEFKRAALELNETGCLAFKSSVDLMRKHEEKMTIVEGGVKERFPKKNDEEDKVSDDEDKKEGNEEVKNEKETVYDTLEKDCSCTRWRQDCFVCRHILFLRREKKLAMFDKSLFIEYFHLERTDDLDAQEEADIKENNNFAQDFPADPFDDDQEDEAFVLEPGQKFRLATDSTAELRDLMCHFGTPHFMEFLWELDVAKRRMRRGQSIFVSRRVQVPVIADVVSVEATEEKEKFDDANETEQLEFMKKVNRRGRPKHSGAGKLKFPRPKKSTPAQGQKSSAKKTNEETVKKSGEEAIVVPDCNEGDESDPGEVIVCLAPPVPGQWGDNTVTMREYASLTTGQFVFDTVVNWWQRVIYHQYVNLGDKTQHVLMLSTEFAVRLEQSWDPAANQLPPEDLHNWTQNGQLWQDGGCRLVVLSACIADHYYAMVAVLDHEQPALYVLESLGGGYAKVPPCAVQFCAFLLWLRTEVGGEGPGFVTSIPSVPRQRQGSNNCGLFLCQNVELILNSPQRFEDLARRGMLGNWYAVQSLDNKRAQLAEQIRQMAADQRLRGGQLEGRPLDLPLPEPVVVYKQVTREMYSVYPSLQCSKYKCILCIFPTYNDITLGRCLKKPVSGRFLKFVSYLSTTKLFGNLSKQVFGSQGLHKKSHF